LPIRGQEGALVGRGDGDLDGLQMGGKLRVGDAVGREGIRVGRIDGNFVGGLVEIVGARLRVQVGFREGDKEGRFDGDNVGFRQGPLLPVTRKLGQ